MTTLKQYYKGVVKYEAGTKVFESKYNKEPQQSIVVTLTNGSEERFYFNPNHHSILGSMKKGDAVIVTKEEHNGRIVKKCVWDEEAPPNTDPQQSTVVFNSPANPPEPTAQSLSESIAQQTSLYLECAKEVMTQYKEGAGDNALPTWDDESLRLVTTTIYLSICKRYNR